jgi:hypothetical protein
VAAAIAATTDIPATRDALFEYLRANVGWYGPDLPLSTNRQGGIDPRTGWKDTHLVMAGKFPVAWIEGFPPQ